MRTGICCRKKGGRTKTNLAPRCGVNSATNLPRNPPEIWVPTEISGGLVRRHKHWSEMGMHCKEQRNIGMSKKSELGENIGSVRSEICTEGGLIGSTLYTGWPWVRESMGI